MDANIYRSKGTLIIDFREGLQRTSLHRDVTIEYVIGGSGKIIVRGKEAKWNYVENDSWMWREEFDVYDKENIASVLPEYIEEYTRPALPWYERPVGDLFKKGGGEWAKEKKVLRVKPGWFEYKHTNIPIEITTNQYIIYK